MTRFANIAIPALALFLTETPKTAFPQESIALHLSAEAHELPSPAAPLLHEDIPEVLSPEDGLWLSPAAPFDWLSFSSAESAFRLTPTYNSKRFSHAILTIWNWHNLPVSQCLITPEGPHSIEISTKDKGAYLITLDGFIDGECQGRLVRNIAASRDLNRARNSWNTDEFFLGICAFPGRYHWDAEGVKSLPDGITETEARALESSHLAALGFQVVRTDESMEMGRRSDGQGYQFNFERMDAAVDAFTSRGFELALQAMNAPDWAIQPAYSDQQSNLWRYPRREEDQRAYLRSLLKNYGEHSRLVQIFNEPDQVDFWSGTPEEYVKHFQFSYDEVRDYSDELPVINGGYSQVDLSRTRFFVEQLRPLIQLPAYHSHGSLPKLIEDFSEIRRLHEEAGYENVRYINSETGQAAWRADQERRMGQFVPQKTLYCWANDHAGVLLFAGRMTLGPKRHTQDFGFLSHYFAPRFVYNSMGALVSALNGASFHSTLLEGGQTFAYTFSRGDDLIIAAFTLEESDRIELSSDADSASLIDEMGNQQTLPTAETIPLLLDGYPRYLILTNASRVSLDTGETVSE